LGGHFLCRAKNGQPVTPQEVCIQSLIPGYRRFREISWPERSNIFECLANQGQRPKALVVTCIDSRVDPALIFDAGPGEILTVRNVANLIPPYTPDGAYHGTSAALEFAVRVMDVPDLIVLGHGMCGGVKALLEGAPGNAQDFIATWMSIAEPARVKAVNSSSIEDHQQCCEHEVVKVSMTNLMTFPWIAERVSAGTLALHGAWFAIDSGLLMTLQPNGLFEEL